jgi:hypothetical protein
MGRASEPSADAHCPTEGKDIGADCGATRHRYRSRGLGARPTQRARRPRRRRAGRCSAATTIDEDANPSGLRSSRRQRGMGSASEMARQKRARGSASTPYDDTITGHVSLGPLSTVPQRSGVPAFQAECREFEPRLPLQTPHSCSGRHDNWTDGLLSDLVMPPNRVLRRSTTRYEAAIRLARSAQVMAPGTNVPSGRARLPHVTTVAGDFASNGQALNTALNLQDVGGEGQSLNAVQQQADC